MPRSLERNWTWDYPEPLRQKVKLLRVRQFAGHCLLTFKAAKKSRHFKTREELETEVQDPSTLVHSGTAWPAGCLSLREVSNLLLFRSERQQHSVILSVEN